MGKRFGFDVFLPFHRQRAETDALSSYGHPFYLRHYIKIRPSRRRISLLKIMHNLPRDVIMARRIFDKNGGEYETGNRMKVLKTILFGIIARQSRLIRKPRKIPCYRRRRKQALSFSVMPPWRPRQVRPAISPRSTCQMTPAKRFWSPGPTPPAIIASFTRSMPTSFTARITPTPDLYCCRVSPAARTATPIPIHRSLTATNITIKSRPNIPPIPSFRVYRKALSPAPSFSIPRE